MKSSLGVPAAGVPAACVPAAGVPALGVAAAGDPAMGVAGVTAGTSGEDDCSAARPGGAAGGGAAHATAHQAAPNNQYRTAFNRFSTYAAGPGFASLSAKS
jgi:hypothetical protein